MISASQTLYQRFGPRSFQFRSVLSPKPDKTELEKYYLSVLGGLTRHWFGVAVTPVVFPIKADLVEDIPIPDEIQDHFGPFYQSLLTTGQRQKLGEFYTPDWLVEHLLRQMFNQTESQTVVDSKGQQEQRFLDPTCGSGPFLLAVIRHLKKKKIPTERILDSVVGFDLNPIAVLTARTNIAIALSSQERLYTPSEIHVYPFDLLRDNLEELQQQCPFSLRFPCILGNPPWINWDRFSDEERRSLHTLWEQYGLFNLSARHARYGGAKKEGAALIFLRVADLFLQEHGHLAFVLPKSLFQTRLAGAGFRRFQIGNKEHLNVKRVDDFSSFPVFRGVSTKVTTILVEKGVLVEKDNVTTFPIPYFRWSSQTESSGHLAQPIHSEDPLSPWTILPQTDHLARPKIARSKVTRPSVSSQTPVYQGYLGANTGGANGIYWVEILSGDNRTVRIRNNPALGKRPVPQIEAEIEAELVFPLLRWKDIRAFQYNKPSLGIIIPQDIEARVGLPEQIMQERFPKTLAYLRQFESVLTTRAAFRKYQPAAPFYSMYNVGPPLFAPYKVIWRRMDSVLRAVSISSDQHPILGNRLLIPQETITLIPCATEEEALYLSGLFNSPEIAAQIAAFCPIGTKGFGSPGMLQHLPIKKFDPGDTKHQEYVMTAKESAGLSASE